MSLVKICFVILRKTGNMLFKSRKFKTSCNLSDREQLTSKSNVKIKFLVSHRMQTLVFWVKVWSLFDPSNHGISLFKPLHRTLFSLLKPCLKILSKSLMVDGVK